MKTQLYFEKAAQTYDTFTDIQEDVFLSLFPLIKEKQFNHIIDLGSGSGRLTFKLFNIFNPKTLIGIDHSKEMIKKAQKEYFNPAIYFLHKDITNLDVDKEADLIFSNASFQWVQDLDPLFAEISTVKQRKLAFSVFLPGTFKELEQVISSTLGIQVTLPASHFNTIDYYRSLTTKYFSNYSEKKVSFTKEFTSLNALLKWIKQVGIRGAGSSPSLHWNSGMIKDIEATYLDQFKTITVSFDVACFCCDV